MSSFHDIPRLAVLSTIVNNQNSSTLPPTNIQVYDSNFSSCMPSSLYSFDFDLTSSTHTKSAAEKMKKKNTEKMQRRQRTAFTTKQLDVLIESYHASRYPKEPTLKSLESKTSLPKDQIKVWFQNRRAKSRREEIERVLKDTTSSLSLLSEVRTETSSNVLSVNSLSHKNCDGSTGKISSSFQLNHNFGSPYSTCTAHLNSSHQHVIQRNSITHESFKESVKTSDISSTPILNSVADLQFSHPSHIPLYPTNPFYPYFFNQQ
ncbi:hypothetical protein CRE_19959 [Caenorhabditis remanei]|uniref:Homeobox domain-containing protein n=1 Tax=Caenorhabditis remanei TaxID=31234 RepID=E3N8D6_CAERE|nr:hypothetical protein CRE_19959 [Caenorhabditis remanei]